MFPNLYYAFKELFGLELSFRSVINTAGLFAAFFHSGRMVMEKEMLFREKQKVLLLRTILIKQRSGEIISVEEYPHQPLLNLF